MTPIRARLTNRMEKNSEFFEVAVNIPGLRTSKLTKSDNSTRFATRSAAVNAVRSFARTLGTEANVIDATRELVS